MVAGSHVRFPLGLRDYSQSRMVHTTNGGPASSYGLDGGGGGAVFQLFPVSQYSVSTKGTAEILTTIRSCGKRS